MTRQLTTNTTLDHLRNDAKRWLKSLRAGEAGARARLLSAHAHAPQRPGLRDVQHALAREHGFTGWAALKSHLATRVASEAPLPRDAARQALHDAALRGDVSRIASLLDDHPDLVSERGTMPGHTGARTALHFAVNGLHEAAIVLLLERGADPNVLCEGDAATPLHFAAERGHFGIIRLLIEHGSDPIGVGDYHELEVIGWATVFGTGDKEIVDYLLAHGARHNIFSAVAVGEVDEIRRIATEMPTLLDHRMDQTNKRRRPLHLAVVKKQPTALATLLDLGANIEAPDGAGFTPLDQAALGGEHAMAHVLLERGAEMRLPAAVGLGEASKIERLVASEPGCLAPGGRWAHLIVRAAEQAPGDVLETLIRLGASPNAAADPTTAIDGTSGYTPLHAAGFFGNVEAATVLLKHGANVSVRDDKYRGTPAGWANYASQTAVRDLILTGPIDIFEAIDRDRADRIPEILARDPQALNRPLSHYSPGPTRQEESHTPLSWSVAHDKAEAARVLIAHGATRDA
jgi:ankyrin repeat protein